MKQKEEEICKQYAEKITKEIERIVSTSLFINTYMLIKKNPIINANDIIDISIKKKNINKPIKLNNSYIELVNACFDIHKKSSMYETSSALNVVKNILNVSEKYAFTNNIKHDIAIIKNRESFKQR